MNWYTLDAQFLSYLRGFECRIPEIDYGQNALKPFFGALFEINDLVYLTQVSHPKKRHISMKVNKDFYKLYDKNNCLIGVVNLNYMFPIPKKYLIEVTYNNISNFKNFKDDTEKNKYITLLKKEMKEIKSKNIKDRASDLYKHKYTFPDCPISKRCFEFKELEQKCFEFEPKK